MASQSEAAGKMPRALLGLIDVGKDPMSFTVEGIKALDDKHQEDLYNSMMYAMNQTDPERAKKYKEDKDPQRMVNQLRIT